MQDTLHALNLWPIVILFLGLSALLFFRQSISKFLGHATEVKTPVGTITTKDVELAAQLGAASVRRTITLGDPTPTPDKIRQLSQNLAKFIGARVHRTWPETSILWLHASPNHD